MYLQDLTYIDVAFSEQPAVRVQKSGEVIDAVCAWQGKAQPYVPIHALQCYLDNMKVCGTSWRLEYIIASAQSGPVGENAFIDNNSTMVNAGRME